MNEKYYVFLSLTVIIAIGFAIDTLVNDKADQDEKIVIELAKNNFTNIKVFGKYMGASCEALEIKRHFQAEKDGKIAHGSACTSEKYANTVVKVDYLSAKPDPTKLSFN